MTDYRPAADRWHGRVIWPDLPVDRPSIIRDIKVASKNFLRTNLVDGGWSARLECIALVALGGLMIGGFEYAYWAQTEKSLWYWRRTDGAHDLKTIGSASVPWWHAWFATLVGCFWAFVGFVATVPLWASIVLLERLLG